VALPAVLAPLPELNAPSTLPSLLRRATLARLTPFTVENVPPKRTLPSVLQRRRKDGRIRARAGIEATVQIAILLTRAIRCGWIHLP